MIGGPNPNAWHNWYHVVGSTYGTWLRGDPRGFRTYRHRQHIEGDYQNPPPPGVYAPIFAKSTANLRYPPLQLNTAQQDLLCQALACQLIADKAELIALAVVVNHFHLLARLATIPSEQVPKLKSSLLQDGRDPAPRHWVGVARREASKALRDAGLKPESPVWAARPKCDPIRDRSHQINVTRYIKNHTRIGAAVRYLDEFYPARHLTP